MSKVRRIQSAPAILAVVMWLLAGLDCFSDPLNIEITSFSTDGSLTVDSGSNAAICSIEWVNSPTSQWRRDWFGFSNIRSDTNNCLAIPMFYKIRAVHDMMVTGVSAQALYYFPFLTSNVDNYGSATITGLLYGATFVSKTNSADGSYYFDGLPTENGTTLAMHDVLYLGNNPPGFPLSNFTISATCVASNDFSIIGSGNNEMWPRKWRLSRNSLYWPYVNGYASGGKGMYCVMVSWSTNNVPYGTNFNVTLARTGTNVDVYINGILQLSSITNYTFTNFYQIVPVPPHELPTNALPVYGNGLMIGNEENDYSNAWEPFKGQIDNILIFNKHLNSNEIYQLYIELQQERLGN
jgi:hypothetical protein